MPTLMTSADAQLTASRRESKYLVPLTSGLALRQLMSKHIPCHEFRRNGHQAKRGHSVQHYITTVYFDTAERDIYWTSLRSRSALKLRAREYYEVDPGLTELATECIQGIHFEPTLWLELKMKDGGRTRKQRFGLPKCDVSSFFADGTITEAMLAIQRSIYGDHAQEVLNELTLLCSQFSTPLRADCIVNYRRQAWQDDENELRVTLDAQVACYLPPEDLWTKGSALTRTRLGSPVYSQPELVLELKSRKGLPDWLTTAVGELGLRNATLPDLGDAAYSKFLASSGIIHG